MGVNEEPSTSIEHLDALLAEGRLSEEEYETLRAAIESKHEESTLQEQKAARRRLAKSWQVRQLGGVCGGIAKFFDVNPWLVRALAVVAAFVSCGAAFLAYVILYAFLPWDEEEAHLVWRFPKSILLVMLGAIVVSFLGFRFINYLAFDGQILPVGTRWSFAFMSPPGIVLFLTILGIAGICAGFLPVESKARKILVRCAFWGGVLVLCTVVLALA